MLGDDLKVNLRFESFVNLEWCKTREIMDAIGDMFESFVNLEWCKTLEVFSFTSSLFESFVNLEWCKTKVYIGGSDIGLRALLI